MKKRLILSGYELTSMRFALKIAINKISRDVEYYRKNNMNCDIENGILQDMRDILSKIDGR